MDSNDRRERTKNQNLQLTDSEILSLRCLALSTSLLDDLNLLTPATSAVKVEEVLQHVLVVMHTVPCLNRKERGVCYLEEVRVQWTKIMER